MIDIPYIAEAAALIGDPARANILSALKDDGVLSATELAYVAGVAPNTASGHLSRLTEADFVRVERRGRHRFYRLACHEVAEALESLEALAARTSPRVPLPGPQASRIRNARSCYDHLAGRVGVKLVESLVGLGYIKATHDDFVLLKRGEKAFTELGVDFQALRSNRRRLTRRCPDWSEQNAHLGGALGAALFSQFTKRGWMRSDGDSRAVTVTPKGKTALRRHFSLDC
jgi:DNA-binding transcriptional ArsR family regulator